jgi:hypothetical protein
MYGPSWDGRPSLARARTKSAGRSKLAQLGIRPAALSAEEAAAFCGMSGAQFLKEVAAGNLPDPIGGLLSKRKLWSLRALESAIDGSTAPHGAVGDDPLMQEIKRRASA